MARGKASVSPGGIYLVELAREALLPVQNLHQDVGKAFQRPGCDIYHQCGQSSSYLASPKTCVKLKFESHDLDDELLTGNNVK